MKKLLTFTLVVIIGNFIYNKYEDYKRFNGPQTNYAINDEIDLNYHDKDVVYNYHNAIAQLNGFVNTQWSANGIDVLNPEKENKKTNNAVALYAQKLASVTFYEKLLLQSKKLKSKNFTNTDVKLFEEKGMSLEEYNKTEGQTKYKDAILKSFKELKVKKGSDNMLIYEIQQLLNKKGIEVEVDGFFNYRTQTALKQFEDKNGFYADGELDLLTLHALLD